MTWQHRQRGATLLVGLIILVVLTLLAVSAIRSSSLNLRIVGNMQFKSEAEAAAQQAIEQVMSSSAIFYTPTAQSIAVDINHDGTTDYTVSIGAPSCLKMATASGYSALFAASAPQDTYWDVKSTVTDSRSGSKIIVHQGVKVRLSAGVTCP